MDPKRVRSLDLVKEVVRDERAAQLSHFDALDTKAGIILGFAGALIVLSPSGRSVIIGIGKVSALASDVAAIATFWPRRVLERGRPHTAGRLPRGRDSLR